MEAGSQQRLTAKILAQLPFGPFPAKHLYRGTTWLEGASRIASHDLQEADAIAATAAAFWLVTRSPPR